jgi:TldD protein
MVNEQKYFASTDGSYIDQDIHRIWPAFFITKIDATTGKFETRNSLSAPMGMGYEYLDVRPQDKIQSVTTLYKVATICWKMQKQVAHKQEKN